MWKKSPTPDVRLQYTLVLNEVLLLPYLTVHQNHSVGWKWINLFNFLRFCLILCFLCFVVVFGRGRSHLRCTLQLFQYRIPVPLVVTTNVWERRFLVSDVNRSTLKLRLSQELKSPKIPEALFSLNDSQ